VWEELQAKDKQGEVVQTEVLVKTPLSELISPLMVVGVVKEE